MKVLKLNPANNEAATGNAVQFKNTENKVVELPAKIKGASKAKIKIKWFDADSPENLTVTEAVIRGALIYALPMLSAIDWHYGTHTMFFIAPVILYMEATAFTMFCPIKALFSNYNRPSHYE